jgi:hypothetical protein
MGDYSLQNVKTRPAKVGDNLSTRRFSFGTTGFAHLKTPTSRFAYFQGRNCRLLARSGAQIYGRGAKTPSPTRPLSSVKSIKTVRTSTTMPWNFLTATSCC